MALRRSKRLKTYLLRKPDGGQTLKMGVKFVDSYIIKYTREGHMTAFTDNFEIDELKVKHAFADAQLVGMKRLIKRNLFVIKMVKGYLEIMTKYKENLDAQ